MAIQTAPLGPPDVHSNPRFLGGLQWGRLVLLLCLRCRGDRHQKGCANNWQKVEAFSTPSEELC